MFNRQVRITTLSLSFLSSLFALLDVWICVWGDLNFYNSIIPDCTALIISTCILGKDISAAMPTALFFIHWSISFLKQCNQMCACPLLWDPCNIPDWQYLILQWFLQRCLFCYVSRWLYPSHISSGGPVSKLKLDIIPHFQECLWKCIQP